MDIHTCSNSGGFNVKVIPMKNLLAVQLGPVALLLVVGCGARTPLDSLADQIDLGTGGYFGTGGSAGNFSSGGRPAAGGAAGGAFFTYGGAIAGGSPSNGGRPSAGGSIPIYFGGSVVATGGRGGSASSGGFPSAGGAIFAAGGAVAFTGGRPVSMGGNMGGSSGTVFRDAGAGGSAGAGGADAGPDGRPPIDSPSELRPDGSADVRDAMGIDGNSCVGLAPNEDLIDDMNDGSRIIPKTNGRVGAWSDSDDGTPGGTMFPDPATPFTMSDTGDVCRKLAVYVKGTGFVDLGSSFSVGLGSPYDASKYTGISFWAKIDPGTRNVIRVAFPDNDSDPNGGICNGTGAMSCYDHFGYRITNMTSTWQKYTVSFSQLSQDTWGYLVKAFDPTSVYEILFEIPNNATFGFWVDDIAFTR